MRKKGLSGETYSPVKRSMCVARIERKYNEVNIISQELTALHGRVCKYGMLLSEVVSHARIV